MAQTFMIIPRGGNEQQEHLKRKVLSFIHEKGFNSLKQACRDNGMEYQSIYRQLNGYQDIKVDTIQFFIKKIDPNYHIENLHGKLYITNRKG